MSVGQMWMYEVKGGYSGETTNVDHNQDRKTKARRASCYAKYGPILLEDRQGRQKPLRARGLYAEWEGRRISKRPAKAPSFTRRCKGGRRGRLFNLQTLGKREYSPGNTRLIGPHLSGACLTKTLPIVPFEKWWDIDRPCDSKLSGCSAVQFASPRRSLGAPPWTVRHF